MANIFILEDEEHSRNAMVHIVSAQGEEYLPFSACDLDSATKLLNEPRKYDLFLLDVNLNIHDNENISGIELARLIRKMHCYEFTPIVMITSVPAMEITAYREIHCYQYVVKPYEKKDIEDVLHKVMSHIEEQKRSTIIVKKDGINYSIHCDHIIYCKAIPRGVMLCLKEEVLEVPYLSVRQLLEKLPKEGFMQCHRMYIVNLDEVSYYDMVNQVIRMKGFDTLIDIGITYKAEVRRLLNG